MKRNTFPESVIQIYPEKSTISRWSNKEWEAEEEKSKLLIGPK